MQKIDDDKYLEKVLSLALDLGKSMIKCGAEVNRVEDTIMRIGHAYGMEKTQVFSIISVIHATVVDSQGRTHTQIRRIYTHSVHFDNLEKLNAFSRKICREKPDIDTARQELDEICQTKKKKFDLIACLGNALVGATFAIFFGGTYLDALAAMPIGVVIYFMNNFIRAMGASKLFFTVIESATAGLLALIFVHFGFGNNPDIIMIADIMLLIPGLMLINSLREMLCGDLMSGLLRLLESIVLAMAIACGFALPIYFWDYIV